MVCSREEQLSVKVSQSHRGWNTTPGFFTLCFFLFFFSIQKVSESNSGCTPPLQHSVRVFTTQDAGIKVVHVFVVSVCVGLFDLAMLFVTSCLVTDTHTLLHTEFLCC